MNAALRIGTTGFGLIAVCYGFARFAFGLFLPEIDNELSLGPTLSGIISGGSFFGYCIAIVASATLTERFGAREVAVCGSLVAAIGMAGIAVAPNAVWLAGAVLLAGSSTGLASPPMAAAVTAAVKHHQQNITNTTINAGTSAGIALSGPIALLVAGQWRLAFGGFALVALLMAFVARITLPRTDDTPSSPQRLPPVTDDVVRLIIAAFLMGAASTALWSFGGQLANLHMGWKINDIGMLWVAIGSAGIFGAFAGAFVARFGLNRTHWMFLGLMSVGILAVGMTGATPFTTLVGGALFGASYVMLTGVYLIWGVAASPNRPAMGLMIGFLMIAVGQTAGAPVFGILMDVFGADHAVMVFIVLGLAAGGASIRRKLVAAR